MNLSTHIIKGNGKRQSELYSHDKLFKSIVLACQATRTPKGQAASNARLVCLEVEKWLEPRPEVTSRDIRIATARHLKKFEPEAAYLYEQQHITI